MASETAYLDHSLYHNPSFAPSDLASSILAGTPYHPPSPELQSTNGPADGKGKAKEEVKEEGGGGKAKGDASLAIARLSFSVEEVTRLLKAEITQNHSALLLQASSTTVLSQSLLSVQHGLSSLSLSLTRLSTKITHPHRSLQNHVRHLSELQRASDLLRRAGRFLGVARRLEIQMMEMEDDGAGAVDGSSGGDRRVSFAQLGRRESELGGAVTAGPFGEEGRKERGMNRAALSIAELDSLLASPPAQQTTNGITTDDATVDASDSTSSSGLTKPPPIALVDLNLIVKYLPRLSDLKDHLTERMEAQIFEGLSTLNQQVLASALQTAFNLGMLPELVKTLLGDLTEAVEGRIRKTFDLASLAKEAGLKDGPPSTTSSYKSRTTGREPTASAQQQWANALWSRIDGLIDDMASCCVKVYTLEKVLRVKKDPASGMAFLDEAMKVLDNKPSFIFWTTLAKTLERESKETSRTSSFIQQTLSMGYPKLLRTFHQFFAKISVQTDTVYTQNQQSPETVLILRSLASFESLYLSRSASRLTEVVNTATSGGSRNPPGATEGITVARIALNELDSGRFDPLLLRSVARGVGSSLDAFATRLENLIAKDSSAYVLNGSSANGSQALNAQVVSSLWHCHSLMSKAETEYNERIMSIIRGPIKRLETVYTKHTDALLTAIKKEFSAIIGRLHKVDYSKLNDSVMGGASPYMTTLMERMTFVRVEILTPYNVGKLKKDWTLDLVRHILRTFVLHASIVSPLGEAGKLKLTSDMTELEFSLGTFLLVASGNDRKNAMRLSDVGEEYLTLRAFRPMLFLETSLLGKPENTVHLPPLEVLHHILVRSPLPLPHQLHNWTEMEYVLWVEAHSEPECWNLLEKGVVQARKERREGAEDVFELMEEVLEEARANLEYGSSEDEYSS